jgi:uncharacterized protein
MFGSRKICLVGLPGIGSVGKVAVDYISNALEGRKVRSFYSDGFPPHVLVDKGVSRPLQIDLKVTSSGILTVTGDAQPIEVLGMYRLAGEILEAVRSEDVTDIIAMAAYVGKVEESVVGAATDLTLTKEIEEEGVPLLRNGVIGGLNGLLAGMTPLYGMSGLCLLGATSGELPVDIKAAWNLLEVAKRVLNLDISLDSLASLAEEEGAPFEDLSPPDDFNISYR